MRHNLIFDKPGIDNDYNYIGWLIARCSARLAADEFRLEIGDGRRQGQRHT
jgi:hypothetical protein